MTASRHFVSLTFSALTFVPIAGNVWGQDYPSRPVRIFSAEAGGGTDFVARTLAQGLTASLGQQVIVENRPSGVVPGDSVAKSAPDGHTLLVSTSVLWLAEFQSKTPYDAVKDFLPITLAVNSPHVLVVHPSLPVKTVRDLIALAKARPGQLNYASGATGGSPHLAAELFKSMAGVNLVRVNYKGSAQGFIDLIGGQVQLTFGTGGSVGAHVKSGRLKPLAVTSSQPSVLFPELATVAASGLPGYESRTVYGAFAPAKTPATIVSRLNQDIVRLLTQAETKSRLFSVGQEVVASTPEELSAAVKSEMQRLGKIIRDAGV